MAASLKVEKGDAGRPEPAELIGGLLAAAIAASEGLEGSAEVEFQRACDGMCVSNLVLLGEFSWGPLPSFNSQLFV